MYIMSRKYDNRDKEGHWLFPYKNAHGYKQCSVCGEIGYHSIYPYCPTCGAKMDMGYATRKRGWWLHVQIPLPLSDGSKECVRCSVCGTHWDNVSNYCPNCGTEMEEEI